MTPFLHYVYNNGGLEHFFLISKVKFLQKTESNYNQNSLTNAKVCEILNFLS